MGSLDGVLRLSGLKNVRGRRVMPGQEYIEKLDDLPEYITGTSTPIPKFENLLPQRSNEPQADLGGELTAQSYDVRANNVQNPEEGKGFWSNLGRALHDYVNPEKRAEMADTVDPTVSRGMMQKSVAQTPPIETAQVQASEGIPPVTASEEEAPGFLQSLKNEVTKPWHGNTLATAGEQAKEFIKDRFTPSLDQSFYDQNPNVSKPPAMIEQQNQKQALDQANLDKAQQQPWEVTAFGATDAFANRPDLVSNFSQYTGINFDEQVKEQTQKYEKVLSDIEKGILSNDANYDEQEKRIKERILSNQSSDADKFYIGLALLMPLLVGGMFGKEAGLAALGGSFKGYAGALGDRQKNLRSDEESLADLYKQRSANNLKRGELELEKMKVPAEIRKNLPKDEYADLKGANIYTFRDPKTGEIVGEGAEILPDFYADLKYGNTEESRKTMRTEASKLAQEKSALERADDATEKIINASRQLENTSLFGKILAIALSEDSNGALKKIIRQQAPEIIVDGRKVNSSVYIDSLVEQMKDAYRRNEQMRAFTNTVANHIGNMAENPQYSGLKPEDLIEQMLILRSRGQNFFVDRAESLGFLRAPLEMKYGKKNRALYAGLNSDEEKNQLEKDKQLMYGSD